MVGDPSSRWTGSEAASALLCICEFALFIAPLSEVVFIPFVSSSFGTQSPGWIPGSGGCLSLPFYSLQDSCGGTVPLPVCPLDSDGAEQCRHLYCFLESLSESTFQWNYPQREPTFLALLAAPIHAAAAAGGAVGSHCASGSPGDLVLHDNCCS